MVRLERSDLRENVTAYAAQLSGEPRTILVPFVNVSERLTFNASFHGLVYGVGLLLQQGRSWSRPVRTVTLLTSRTFSCSRTMLCLTTFGSCDSAFCSAPPRTAASPQRSHIRLQGVSGDGRGVPHRAAARNRLQPGQHQLHRGTGASRHALQRCCCPRRRSGELHPSLL